MDEMLVRPKYSRPSSTPRNRRKQPQNDMMSTVFAVKLLVVVVFLSAFALFKAAHTPATDYFISKVSLITTENFDTNKYVMNVVSTLGIKLPEKAAVLQDNIKNIEAAAESQKTAETISAANTETKENAALNNNQNDIALNNSSDNSNKIDTSAGQQEVVQSSGISTETGSDVISDTISAMNQVPVLEEKEIKSIADKYAFIFPIKGEIESSFGIRTEPLSGRTEFHSGIDIAANTGTSIKAALAGEVSEIGSTPELGKYIKIKHNDGISTVYAYCSLLIAKQGQKVNQGDAIAKVGDTEGMRGSLHFEVWKDGKAADPEKLLNLLNK